MDARSFRPVPLASGLAADEGALHHAPTIGVTGSASSRRAGFRSGDAVGARCIARWPRLVRARLDFDAGPERGWLPGGGGAGR